MTALLAGLAGEDPRVPGQLTWNDDEYRLVLESFIEEPAQLHRQLSSDGRVVAISRGEPVGIVRDFMPRTLWCVEGDAPLTLLDAQMSIGSVGIFSCEQVYTGRRLLRGAHVADESAPMPGLRFSLPLRWAAGWLEDRSLNKGQTGVSPWVDGVGPGLAYRPPEPRSVWDLTQRDLSNLLALFKLWTGEKFEPLQVEVDVPDVGWCSLGKVPPSDKQFGQRADLLPIEELTLSRISQWLPLSQKLGPVPHVALHAFGVLQADAQVVAVALEGLHRRLHPDKRRFPGISKGAVKRARKAAVDAAGASLGEHGIGELARNAFRDSLGQVDEVSYRERLNDLVGGVREVAPGLLGPDPEAWINDMCSIRNSESHQLPGVDNFDDKQVARYYVMSASGRWLLQIAILTLLATPELIRSSLRGSSKFGFALANIDREAYWPGFSAYEAFREQTLDGKQD